MSTILRSLKFMRKLNVGSGGKRLGFAALQRVDGARLIPQVQVLASLTTENRNYVTNVAVKQEYSNTGNIDLMLNDLDRKIRNFGNIYKNDVEQLLQAVTEKGSLTSTQGLLLIRCCGDFLSSESYKTRRTLVKNVWEIIKELGTQIDVSHYNALLLVNLENETDFSPLDILLEMKEKNIEPNRVTFQRLIQQYCNKGDIAGATKILEHMSTQEIPINEIIFNSLIKGHSEAGDVPSAVKILDIMKQAGINPTSRSYTAILCMHAKIGDIEAIRKTLDECKNIDILLADKEILEVIYTLAINKNVNHIDELMSLLQKGSLYNRDAITYIYKLIEKNCTDSAFKLLKSLVKTQPKVSDNETNNYGQFFIRKLVTSDLTAESVTKYCTMIMEENINDNPFHLALFTAFTYNVHHLVVPLLKALKESGREIREHYFYPILVSYSKANNLQGILNTVKTMIFDFNITPSIITLKDYIIPYMVESPLNNITTLVNNNIPFSLAANSMLLHLLNENKPQQAKKLMYSTKMAYRTTLLVNPLVSALESTKDVQSFISIVHYQYSQMLNLENNNENNGEQTEYIDAKKFSSICLVKAINALPKFNQEHVIELLQGYLKNGINIDAIAVEKIKQRLSESITPEITDLLNQLLSNELTPTPIRENYIKRQFTTNNLDELEQKAENSVEMKMILLLQYAKIKNHEGVEKLLQELKEENPTYTVGFCASLIDYYSKDNNLEEAEKWFNQLFAIDPHSKIDKSKILNYAELLVQNNRSDDALKVLQCPVHDEVSDRSNRCERFLVTVKKCCPDKIDEFFNMLNNKYFTKVTATLLGPVIRAPLESGDISKAIEKFKWACENFKLTPQRNVLMMNLINNEDAKSLQHVTDLCTQIYGEMNALFDLAIAFFDCNRARQARKILETPGLRLRRERVLFTAAKLSEQGNTDKLENYIQLLTGLFFDMDPLYILLLQSYEKKGDWEKCLALWTQMQEDNIQPSVEFMAYLEKILKKAKQEIPFAKSSPVTLGSESGLIGSETFHDALIARDMAKAEEVLKNMPPKQLGRYYPPLIEAYLIENDIENAVKNLVECIENDVELDADAISVVSSIFSKLLEQNDFDSIYKIATTFNNKTSKNIPVNLLINSCYFEAGKYKDYITRLESLLEDPTKKNSVVNNMFHNTVAAKAIHDNIEVEEKLRKFAYKAIEGRVFGPINTLWIHEHLKGSPEAEKIWEEHLKHMTSFHSISSLYICKDRSSLSKVPDVAEKLSQSENVHPEDKRRSFASFFKILLDSDDPNKFELIYQCVLHGVKAIGLEKINPKILNVLEENLPNKEIIDDLKTKNARLKEETTG